MDRKNARTVKCELISITYQYDKQEDLIAHVNGIILKKTLDKEKKGMAVHGADSAKAEKAIAAWAKENVEE